MPHAPSPRIHPSAVISPDAELAEDAVIGAYTVIEGAVRVGPGCVIRPRALLCGPLNLGRGNVVFSGAVLGERPQHLKYNDEATSLEIGDDNVFRENVTVHRGTTQSWTTRIGSRNYFMVGSHVAHDCRIGNQCILANGALLAGHVTIGDNVYLSGNCAVHQFASVGRLALLSGCSSTTKDIPPFMIQEGRNAVVGVNVVGMRRAGISHDDITAVRRAFNIVFRQRMVIPAALERVERELPGISVVTEFVEFIRTCSRGISPIRERRPGLAA